MESYKFQLKHQSNVKLGFPAGTIIVSILPSGHVSILTEGVSKGPYTIAEAKIVSPKHISVGHVGHTFESFITN